MEGKSLRDALLIIGALSSIGKQLLFSLSTRKEDWVFILVDQPARTMELLEFSNSTGIPKENIVMMSLDIRDVHAISETLSVAVSGKYYVKYFVYLVGANTLKHAFAVTEKLWDEMFSVNLKGFFFAAQCISTHMMQRGGGSVVSIASQHGLAPNTERAVYCASKAGLIRLSEVLALEWAKYNIRVNTVSPTFIVTEGNAHEVETNAFRNKHLNGIPLRRFAEPSDISEAVLFLLSDQARLITGHNLVVDGGWLLNRA